MGDDGVLPDEEQEALGESEADAGGNQADVDEEGGAERVERHVLRVLRGVRLCCQCIERGLSVQGG